MNAFKSLINKISSVYYFRFINVTLSILFALWYSKLMGLEIRSFLTFVLLTNTLLSYFFLSGFTFGLRTTASTKLSKHLIANLFVIALFSSMMIVLIQSQIIQYYSGVVLFDIPENARTSIYLYALISTLANASSEVLSSLNTLKHFIVIEFVVITSQICIFAALYMLKEFSLFVTVLTTYTFSYILSIFATIVLLVNRDMLVLPSIGSFRVSFSNLTFSLFLKALLVNIMQRLDKILIPFFYPATLLAQVTTFAAALGIFRFIPESEARLFVHKSVYQKGGRVDLRTKFFFSLLILGTTCTSVLGIYFILGPVWLPSLGVIFLVSIFEILSWQYQRVFAQFNLFRTKFQLRAIAVTIVLYVVSLLLLMQHFFYTFTLTFSVFIFGTLYFLIRRKSFVN